MECEHEVAKRESQLTDALWTILPWQLSRKLRMLKGQVALLRNSPLCEDSVDEVYSVELLLQKYRSALDEAIALVPKLHTARGELPRTPPDPDPLHDPFQDQDGVLGDAAAIEARWLAKTLPIMLRGFDPSFSMSPVGQRALRVWFQSDGAPFSLLAEVTETRNGRLEYHFALATSISTRTPSLKLERQTWAQTLRNAFGIRPDIQVGDERFDEAFSVNGVPEAASSVLTLRVRNALLDFVSTFGITSLETDAGKAVLRWNFEPSAAALQLAIRTLMALRNAPLETHLLRETRRFDPRPWFPRLVPR